MPKSYEIAPLDLSVAQVAELRSESRSDGFAQAAERQIPVLFVWRQEEGHRSVSSCRPRTGDEDGPAGEAAADSCEEADRPTAQTSKARSAAVRRRIGAAMTRLDPHSHKRQDRPCTKGRAAISDSRTTTKTTHRGGRTLNGIRTGE